MFQINNSFTFWSNVFVLSKLLQLLHVSVLQLTMFLMDTILFFSFCRNMVYGVTTTPNDVIVASVACELLQGPIAKLTLKINNLTRLQGFNYLNIYWVKIKEHSILREFQIQNLDICTEIFLTTYVPFCSTIFHHL